MRNKDLELKVHVLTIKIKSIKRKTLFLDNNTSKMEKKLYSIASNARISFSSFKAKLCIHLQKGVVETKQ